MPFITQGKTNLKYILIVVILAAIAGGGILGYQYWWAAKKETAPPEVKVPEATKDKTADWVTFTYHGSEEFMFEIKHPPAWSITVSSNQFTVIDLMGPTKEGYTDLLLENHVGISLGGIYGYGLHGIKERKLTLSVGGKEIPATEYTSFDDPNYEIVPVRYLFSLNNYYFDINAKDFENKDIILKMLSTFKTWE